MARKSRSRSRRSHSKRHYSQKKNTQKRTIHVGPNGGKFVMIKGKKRYLSTLLNGKDFLKSLTKNIAHSAKELTNKTIDSAAYEASKKM